MAQRYCDLCGEPKEDAPVIHDIGKCELTERLKGREEIKKLKASVKNWQDEWYKYRDLLGGLYFHHPAIDSDTERAYYINNLKTIKEKNCVDHSCATCDDCNSYIEDFVTGTVHVCRRTAQGY